MRKAPEKAADRRLFLDQGMALITKPFAFDDFATEVARLLPAWSRGDAHG